MDREENEQAEADALLQALAELSRLDPADAPDKADELAAELARRLDEAEPD